MYKKRRSSPYSDFLSETYLILSENVHDYSKLNGENVLDYSKLNGHLDESLLLYIVFIKVDIHCKYEDDQQKTYFVFASRIHEISDFIKLSCSVLWPSTRGQIGQLHTRHQ